LSVSREKDKWDVVCVSKCYSASDRKGILTHAAAASNQGQKPYDFF
jgi:hypothetical protein